MNSATVGTLVGVGTLIATVVLALLTARYVRLTSSIANVASQQMDFIREAERRRVAEAEGALQMLAVRLRAALETLEPEPDLEEMRVFSLVSAGDIDLLEVLARPSTHDNRGHAVIAVMGLRGIVGLAARAQAVGYPGAFRFTDADMAAYRDGLIEARQSLDAIIGVSLADPRHVSDGGVRTATEPSR